MHLCVLTAKLCRQVICSYMRLFAEHCHPTYRHTGVCLDELGTACEYHTPFSLTPSHLRYGPGQAEALERLCSPVHGALNWLSRDLSSFLRNLIHVLHDLWNVPVLICISASPPRSAFSHCKFFRAKIATLFYPSVSCRGDEIQKIIATEKNKRI